MPRVSIVIPTYNRVALLRETLDSALAQTYRDLEIIVVDNASEDDTPAFMARYTERDARVQYVRKPVNKGMVDSYNMGYRLAQGEFVHLLDSDDTITPDATAAQVDLMDRRADVDLIYTRYFYVDAAGRKLCLSDIPPQTDAETFRQMLRSNIVQMNSALMRRKIMGVTPDGPYDQNVPTGASDWHFLLKLLLNGSRIMGLSTPMLLYRIHPGNHTRNIAGFENDLKTTHAWLFSDPRLPENVRAEKDASLELHYLWFCLGYYLKGDFDEGRRTLMTVWNLRPDWHATPDVLVQRLAGVAANPWVPAPHTFVDNLLAHPPAELPWLKDQDRGGRLRAKVWLVLAMRAIDQDGQGDVDAFQHHVRAAFDADPGLRRDSRDFVEAVAEYSQRSITNDPHVFVERVMRALPSSVDAWVNRNDILGTFYTADAFGQYASGNHRRVITDVLAAGRHRPRTMLNRGVLSILTKSMRSLIRQAA